MNAGPKGGTARADRPLRIGLVCPYSMEIPGGVQNHVLGLAGHLTARGHRVRVLAPGRPDRQRLADYGLGANQFDSAGAAVPVPYNGSVARVNFGPVGLARVRRWLRHGAFDLVHLHEPVTPSVSGWGLLAAPAGLPVVATFHTATPRSRTMELASRLLRPVIARIDAGIAVSEVARHVVVQHLGRDARVIPNGFDRSSFLPPHPAGPPAARGSTVPEAPWRSGDRPRIAYLGRLDEPRKGLDVLLAALPAIRAVHPDLEVVVAGQGRRRTGRSGTRGHSPATLVPGPGLVVPGRIEDRRRAELLASVDVFVAPHVARESFGIVLIEAMTAGAAVVASDLVPFADLLAGDDGRLGYLFAAGDPDALARAALVALADDRRPLLERAAASTTRFDWSVVGAEIEAVYRSTLLGRGAGTARGSVDPGAELLPVAQWALRLVATGSLGETERRALLDGVRLVLDEDLPIHERRRAGNELRALTAGSTRRPSLHTEDADQYVRPSSGAPDRRLIPDSRDRSKERA